MPVQLSKEQKLQRLVEECGELVGSHDAAPNSLSRTHNMFLSTFLKKAGYQNIAPKFLEVLDNRLKAAGVATFPDLVDPTNTRKTRIYIFDRDHPIEGVQHPRMLFAEEEQLSRFLTMNFPVMSYIKKAGLHLLGREVRIAENCVIDLLAEDRKSHDLVGLELKAQQCDDRLPVRLRL